MRLPCTLSRLALVVSAGLFVAACDALVEPAPRNYVDIFDIQVPTAVAVPDTLRIAFRYPIDCGPLPTVDVRIREGAVRVAVWKEPPRDNRICPGIFLSARTEVTLASEARTVGPTEVRFRQSTGPDSVRVVASAPALRAP